MLCSHLFIIAHLWPGTTAALNLLSDNLIELAPLIADNTMRWSQILLKDGKNVEYRYLKRWIERELHGDQVGTPESPPPIRFLTAGCRKV